MPITAVTAEEKREQAKLLMKEAREILTNPESSAEDKGQVEPLIEDARRLNAESLQLDELDKLKDAEVNAVSDKGVNAKDGTSGSYKNFGQYLRSVWRAMRPINPVLDPRLKWFDDEVESGTESKDLAENIGSSGGFLVPVETRMELLAVMGEDSVVRSRATVIPMTRRQIQMPRLDQDDTAAGQPHWFGGMQFFWQEEGSEKSQSDPEFGRVTLTAHKLIGYTRASDELLEDSAVSLDAFLNSRLGFAGGAMWMEDFAFLQGDGAGKPLGILNSGATITVIPRTQQSITYDDLADMLEKFLPSGRGVWIATQSLMAEMLLMNGPTGNPSYIWGNATSGVPNLLLGRPIIWTEKLPTGANAGKLVLADLTYYLIGDRQRTTVDMTKQERWKFDQTSWRMVHRVDGQPWLNAPLTYQDGSTQVSPFVMLGAEAT